VLELEEPALPRERDPVWHAVAEVKRANRDDDGRAVRSGLKRGAGHLLDVGIGCQGDKAERRALHSAGCAHWRTDCCLDRMPPNRIQRSPTPLQLRQANEALRESQCLIEKARRLESAERWAEISRNTYRQILDAHEALGRLEHALRALNERLHGEGEPRSR